MKSTDYSVLCNKIFKKFFLNQKKEEIDRQNLILEKANIQLDYEEYYSFAIMNTILALVISIVVFAVLHMLFPNNITFTLLFLVPLISMTIFAAFYLYYPKYLINSRAENVDRFLPYAINFISSMAVAGVSPSEIFQTLSTIKVYGEIQKEAKRIAKEINIMGIDNVTALKNAIDLSPSRKFISFLQGMIGTIQSGSDLNNYLSNVSDKYLEDDLIERKKNLELLGVVAEAFVIAVIAFPIFLVIILSIMGFFGGSMEVSVNILFLFSFVVLPLVYLGFYILIRSATSENISRYVKRSKEGLIEIYYDYKKPIYIFLISIVAAIIFGIVVYSLSQNGFFGFNDYILLDIIFIGIIILIWPVSHYLFIKFKEKRDIQEKFPDFLIEVSDSLLSGMNTVDSIKTAEKGRYGKLNEEIKKMKSQLSWNISVKKVFHNFSERVKSGIIQRIVIIINEGLIMGGNTSNLFNAAAKEVNQINQIDHQRKASMSIYMSVILICFSVFLAIILILDKTIFQSFFELQSKQVLQTTGIINISQVDPDFLKYGLFSFVYVQAIGAGVLAGYMMDGKLTSGVRYGCILALISLFVFKFWF